MFTCYKYGGVHLSDMEGYSHNHQKEMRHWTHLVISQLLTCYNYSQLSCNFIMFNLSILLGILRVSIVYGYSLDNMSSKVACVKFRVRLVIIRLC